jgi:putative ABC transport system permease protein
VDALIQDLRYALRTLLKSPGFTLVAVLTLALGIGANTAIYTLIHRLLFDPAPFVDARGLVSIWQVAPRGNDHNEYTVADFRSVQEQARSFEQLAAHVGWNANLTDAGEAPERVQGFLVTANWFATLGLLPMLGRSFTAGEDVPGHDAVLVLSYGVWQRRFGADSTIVGRAIPVNGVSRTVIGVMPPGVRYPAPAEVWAPIPLTPERLANRRSHYLLVTGRLRPGVSPEAAQAEVAGIAARLAADHPESNTGWGANVRPFVRDATRDLAPILLMLFAAVGLVLLIACVNVANLMVARGTARAREVAIRAALGASRRRVASQLLTESLVLASLGGLLGIAGAVWGVGALVAEVPEQQGRWMLGLDHVGVDLPVLAFAVALSALTALLFGIAPAVRASRTDLAGTLHGSRSSPGLGRHRLRRVLVGVEMALALVLLVGAGLMVRTARFLATRDLGFDVERAAVTSLQLPYGKYSAAAARGWYARLEERLRGLPGVSAVGLTSLVPLCQCNSTDGFTVVGAPPPRPGEEPEADGRVVTPGYFAALGMRVLRGRGILATDDSAAPRVVVVTQNLARRWLGGENVMGRRLLVAGDPAPSEIVGVLADVRHDGPAREAPPEFYQAFAQAPQNEMTVVVRAAGDPATQLPAVRAVIRQLDPEQPVYDQATMRTVAAAVVGPQRFVLRLLTAMAVLALLLAAVGIYGVIAHLVAERTREIGIRVALGGDATSVAALVVRQGMAPALWGLAAGLASAAALTGLMRRLLVGVHPIDPLTYAAVAALLLAVAALACLVPARRASKVDPMVALRSE